MGLVNLQVYNTVYNITERNNKLSHYIPGYKYVPVNFDNLEIALDKYKPEDKEKNMMNYCYIMEKKLKSEKMYIIYQT